MKQFAIFVLLLTLSAASYTQQINPSLTKQDYLKKSKNQKKAALIMLGGGAALVVAGFVFPKGESEGFTGSYYGLSNVVEEFENDGIKAAIRGTGVLSMLGSIPLFIASVKNKRRAMSLSFDIQKTPQLQNNKFIDQSIPSINLKLSL
jgi:hypothetical protein